MSLCFLRAVKNCELIAQIWRPTVIQKLLRQLLWFKLKNNSLGNYYVSNWRINTVLLKYNMTTHHLLHVADFTGPSSGSTQLWKHRTENVKFFSAQQAKQVYYYRNIKGKLYKASASIQLFCTIVCSLMMGQWVLKLVGTGVL